MLRKLITKDMKYEKNKKISRINSNNGITLIALAITIVVLLILAGISIGTLVGENSIIEKAMWAAFSQEMTSLREQIEIKQIENSKEMVEEETDKPIFTTNVITSNLPKSLKMEILYIRENMPAEKEPTKKYYIENLLDYLVDDTNVVKGIY